MLQPANQTEVINSDRTCEAISSTAEACELSAACYCTVCGKWFCAAHLADELAHECEPEPGDEGGEG